MFSEESKNLIIEYVQENSVIDGILYKAMYSFWLGRYVYPINQPECFE